MEDPNQELNSPLNRIEALEKIIHRHKFAVSGGSVMGGFSKLPKNQSELPLQQRLANIQKARSEYELAGENIDISGSFDDGFEFS